MARMSVERLKMDKSDVFLGHCVHCRAEITATTPKQWAKAVEAPCPRCGRPW